MDEAIRMMRVAVPRALQRLRPSLSEALSGRRRRGDNHRMMPAVSSIVLGSRLRPASVLKHASNVSYPCSPNKHTRLEAWLKHLKRLLTKQAQIL